MNLKNLRLLLLAALAGFPLTAQAAIARPAKAHAATEGAKGSSDEHFGAGVVKADFKVVKDGIEQDRVVNFMKEMATKKTVKVGREEITFDKMKAAWSDKTDSNWMEDEFRAAAPNMHEWIPSNYMLRVIERAQTSNEGLQWIDLQNKMRSMTDKIIFNPKKTNVVEKVGTKSYIVLEGHTGALENHKNHDPLTVGQAEFHDDLRAVFDKNKTMAGVVEGMKQVVKEWVWDGSDPGMAIHPDVFYFHGKTAAGDKELRAKQAQNYKDILSMFDGIIAQVKEAPKADATADKASESGKGHS